MPRTISAKLWIDWSQTGSYVDESINLIDARGDMRVSPYNSGLAASQGLISSMSVTLRNPNGRYSPQRTDSPLHTWIANGGGYHAPCYLEVSVDGGVTYSRIFSGVLKLPSERTMGPESGPTVQLESRSMEEYWLQRRISTTQSAFAALHDNNPTEADVIDQFLTAAGVAAVKKSVSRGIFPLPWAWLDDESAIAECWAVAAACGGMFYADPDGLLRYENMSTWQTAERSTNVQLALSRDSMSDLRWSIDDRDLHNVVIIEAAPRTLGAVEIVWEPKSFPVVAPGQTRTISAKFDAPIYAVYGLQWEAVDDGGRLRSADVSVVSTYNAQRADLTITNNATVRVLLHPVRIVGVPVVGGPEIEEKVSSAQQGQNASWFAARGDRTLSVRSNVYVQSNTHARSMAQYLLDRCEYARLTALASGVPGVPSLRLGDRVSIADAPTMSSAFVGYLIGISWRLSPSGFAQDLEIIQASQMYRHDNNYFRLGTDTVGSTRRIFY